MLTAAFAAREAWSRRVSTSVLNRWFEAAVDANPPPAPGGKRIKLRYITQARNRPPTFVVFGTRIDQLPDQLSPLSVERHPPRSGFWRGAGADQLARRRKIPFADGIVSGT